MPGYSNSKTNYWLVEACGKEEKGMQESLQKVTFLGSSNSFSIFKAKS